jgi:NAD(P)-dependent dehydrogenase (short-subunit alcohol dehydrogenase family)
MAYYPAPFDLSGKIAVVTGAASGLGVVFAESMADAGADVVCADIDEAGLAQTVRSVEALGRRALAVRCDVTDEVAVKAMIGTTLATFGQLDIIFNNAGIADKEPGLLHQYSTADWNAVIAVDLTGVFFCCREALAVMLPRKCGKVINIASMWGLAGSSSIFPIPAYNAAKGGVVNLTRELGLQYAPHGIQVNAICPGFYRSRLGPYDDPEFAAAISAFTPAGRFAEAHELKGTAIYLASAASDFLNGSLIVADGGCLAK